MPDSQATSSQVVLAFLQDVIADLVDANSILPTDSAESLGLDSLDIVEIQVRIKQRFGVSLDIATLATLENVTLERLSEVVQEHRDTRAFSTVNE